MNSLSLEKRLTALEGEVARLKSRLESREPWWERIAGTFADDPVYQEAMKLGRQYRQSQRPRSTRKRR